MDDPRDTTTIVLPRSYRALEVASVVICLGLLAWLGRAVALGVSTDSPGALAIGGALVLGYLAADLASGIVHFAADTFGSIDTPIVGKKFILPFRAHHDRPWEITTHDFVETNGDSCFAALFVLVPVVATVDVTSGGTSTAIGAFTGSLVAFVVMTNQLHKWAHTSVPPRIVRLLQASRLVLDPKAHAIHHRAPHEQRYCITSGLLNPLVDRVGLFAAVARLFGKPFGRGVPPT